MEERIRINKYLSQAGVLSRRKADEAVQNGEITINGMVATMGETVSENDEVRYKGDLVTPRKEKVVIAYNKPLGQECTSAEASKDSVFNYVDFPEMLYYVGRLDKNSQGLLLLTNDGELSNEIQKARNNHEKEYVVRVNKPLTAEFVNGMRGGVPLEERSTKKCKVKQIGKNTFNIILTEGINRQIRKMCEYFGYRVEYLKRVRVMNIELGNLEKGKWRYLTPEEVSKLRSMIS